MKDKWTVQIHNAEHDMKEKWTIQIYSAPFIFLSCSPFIYPNILVRFYDTFEKKKKENN